MDKRGAVGFIEAEGLPAAIAAADAAVKSANVRLVGRENSRGGGLITIKIAGDVGAVKAALEAAKAVSDQVRRAYSVLVIPRPAEGVKDALVWNENTMGAMPEVQPKPDPIPPASIPDTHEAELPQGEGTEASEGAAFRADEPKATEEIEVESEAEGEKVEGDVKGTEAPEIESEVESEAEASAEGAALASALVPEDNSGDIVEDVPGDGPEPEGDPGESASSQSREPKPRGRRRANNKGRSK